MEHSIAVKLCTYLINSHTINKKNLYIYIYGIELLLSFISSTLTIVCLGIIFNVFIQTIVFLAIFIILRRFTGGYHANTYMKCKIATITVYLLVLTLSEFTMLNSLHYLLLLVVGLATIIKMGPIENPNKPITPYQNHRNRIISILLFVGLTIVSAFLYYFDVKIHTVMYYSLLFVILLMILVKFNLFKANVKGGVLNENNKENNCSNCTGIR